MDESLNQPVNFPGPKGYWLERKLGQGACGQTVVLHDRVIDERFVCKKYAPFLEKLKEELFQNFVREIKLLHLLHHPNVVRVFSYFLYPERHLGYILMEYVQGTDIDSYIHSNPESINEIFRQTIEGFSHLEESKVLHRDIRPLNLMVDYDGRVKIIDLGFGKQVLQEADFDKSVSLNWWCELPADFNLGIYDFSTEVYFVGKLFHKLVLDHNIENFKHYSLLKKMCAPRAHDRTKSFADVRNELLREKFISLDLEGDDLYSYRAFSDTLFESVSTIEAKSKFYDAETVQLKLEACFRNVMLEEFVPRANLVLNCFINGNYRYKTNARIYVSTLKAFLEIFRSSNLESKKIIVGNLQTRLSGLVKNEIVVKGPFDDMDDDIPF